MSFLSRVMMKKRKAHFSANVATPLQDHSAFDGARKKRSSQTKNRVGLLIFGFVAFYAVVGGRLIQYGMAQPEIVSSIPPADRLMASRPDLLDRNGEVLATDIRTVSLFAEPHRIVDVDEAVE